VRTFSFPLQGFLTLDHLEEHGGSTGNLIALGRAMLDGQSKFILVFTSPSAFTGVL